MPKNGLEMCLDPYRLVLACAIKFDFVGDFRNVPTLSFHSVLRCSS